MIIFLLMTYDDGREIRIFCSMSNQTHFWGIRPCYKNQTWVRVELERNFAN